MARRTRPAAPPRSRRMAALPLAALLAGLAACGTDGSDSASPAPAATSPAPDAPAAPTSAAPTSSAAPTPAPPAPAPSSTAVPPPVPAEPSGTTTVLADGLELPWGLAFLPGGDALVSERDSARVLRVPAAGGEPTVVRTVEQAAPAGEGGLLGIALSPTFADDGLVYAYVTTEADNRVVRFALDGGPVEEVLGGIPKGRIHNGGRIAFGPDGNLYVGTGDIGDTSLAQDPGSLGGKVLRMTPAGEPVSGTLVFSDGHRNVQGLDWDGEGRLYATEFGQDRFDEVNLVREGDDGGWPEVEGAGTGGGRYAEPLLTWQPAEASPSGLTVRGDALFVAALRGERLWRVPLEGDGSTGEPEALLQGELGRLRAVEQAPDGALWLLTSNGEDDQVVRYVP